MTAYSEFQHNIESARDLTAMYSELRTHRDLGRRGRLPPGHEELLWLPRSSVVAAISSLDAYVHAVLYDRIPRALRSDAIPEALCDAMADVLEIRNGKHFRAVFPIFSKKKIYGSLTKHLRSTRLVFQSYQRPEKIIAAYNLLGHADIFESVANMWRGPETSSEDIKRRLVNYVNRRNQIAHEGDRDANGSIRHMQPKYAKDCVDFTENLVLRLDRIVYD